MKISPLEELATASHNVLFEVPDEAIGFHELPIACGALGSFVATHAKSPNTHLPAALLGVKLQRLNIKTPESGDLITVEAQLDLPELRIFAAALRTYVEDTALAVRGHMAVNNTGGCLTRAVEGEMARVMFQQASAAIYSPDALPLTTHPIGFQ